MANKNYLDKSGLAYFWGRVKEWITGKHYLTYDEQGLTDVQRAQARANIGAGTYTKPSDGIPKADLSTAVQSALDNALQSIPIATSSIVGGVKEGNYVTIASDGAISANTATSAAPGVVQLSTDIEADSASNAKAVTPNAVVNYVSTQVGTAFRYGGSISFENLPVTPSSSDLNSIYNITDSFTTTSAFIEGAGKTYPAGTNIIVASVSNTPKYDVVSGFLDLSPYATSSWVTENFMDNTNASNLVYNSELIAITDAEISAIVV